MLLLIRIDLDDRIPDQVGAGVCRVVVRGRLCQIGIVYRAVLTVRPASLHSRQRT